MNSKYKYLIKNVGLLTIGNFASKILVFFLIPLYTSVLSTSEYGIFDLGLSICQVTFPVFSLNISESVMRFAMDKGRSIKDIIRIGLHYMTISIVIMAAFMFICSKVSLIPQIGNYEFYIWLYYVFYILNQFMIQLAKGMENVKSMAVGGFIGTVTMVGFNILFLLVFKWGLNGFFLANILCQAVPALYIAWAIKLHKYFGFDKINAELKRSMLSYCVPLIFTALGWLINNTSDKYVVSFMMGTSANGLLSIAYKIPNIINILIQIFNQAWIISAVREFDNDNKDFYKNMYVYEAIGMVLFGSLLILFSKPLASILYAKDFYQAWIYAPYLILSSVIGASSGYIGQILGAAKDSKTLANSVVVGALANLGMNILFVYLIGIQGATIATVISNLIIYWLRLGKTQEYIISKYYYVVYFAWILLFVQSFIAIHYGMELIQIAILTIMVLLFFKPIKYIVSRMLFRKNK